MHPIKHIQFLLKRVYTLDNIRFVVQREEKRNILSLTVIELLGRDIVNGKEVSLTFQFLGNSFMALRVWNGTDGHELDTMTRLIRITYQ